MATEPNLTIHPQTPGAFTQSLWLSQFAHPLGRFGYPFNLAFGLLACLAISGPMVGVEVGPLPLLGCWFLRLPFVWKSTLGVLHTAIAVFLLAWAGWLCASLLWSPDRGQGLHELANLRWAWLPMALAPIMNRRHWLASALAIGLLLGHGAQIAEWLGLATFNHPPNPGPPRFSGWWHHPVMGGGLCVVSAGFASGLCAFAFGRSTRWVLAGLAWLVLALLCVVLTGTRGALLAAIGAPILAITIRIFALPRGPGRYRAAGIGLGFVAIVALAITLFITLSPAGRSMQQRIATGVREVSAPASSAQGDTAPMGDMGARIWMAARAIDLWKTHPIRGVGAGGYRAAVSASLRAQGTDPAATPIAVHHQAHSTPLHMLATGGLIALLLFVAFIVAAAASALRTMRCGAVHSPLSLAPPIALAALGVFGLAESIHINAHTASIACVLLTFCFAPPEQGPAPQTSPSSEPSVNGSRETNGSACSTPATEPQ